MVLDVRRFVSVLALACALASASFVACQDTGIGGVGSSSASGGGVGPAIDKPPNAPSTSDPPFDEDVEPPIIACTVLDVDGGDDAGDAGVDDAGADASDAGDPCASYPPPVCANSTTMVIFGGGWCYEGTCLFYSDRLDCPGGCYRQIDGGNRCSEIAEARSGDSAPRE